MASGFGLTGSTGRCYGVWTEFSECMRDTTDPGHCRSLRDDYLECLHHRKEYTRLNAVYRERKKQLAAGVDVLKDRIPKD